jgi:multisubunit Na+/H+ antiporter MnhG subunit
MQSIYAVVIAVIAYFAIQYWDDSRAKTEGREPASTGKRVALLFFLVMVTLIGGHLVSNAVEGKGIKSEGGSKAHDVEIPRNDIWKRIPEEVRVGPPPF